MEMIVDLRIRAHQGKDRTVSFREQIPKRTATNQLCYSQREANPVSPEHLNFQE
jgi:hypothetical protein